MEIIDRKKIVEVKNVIVGHKCDICGKTSEGDNYPEDWHYFNSQHSAWGSDSFESAQWHLVCSPECFFIQLKRCIDFHNEESTTINDMSSKFVISMIEYFEKIKAAKPKEVK